MRFFLVFFVYLSITFFDVWLKKGRKWRRVLFKTPSDRCLQNGGRKFGGGGEVGTEKKTSPVMSTTLGAWLEIKAVDAFSSSTRPTYPFPPSPLFYYYSKPFHYCFTNHSFADYKLGHLYKPIVLCHNVKHLLWLSSCSPLVMVKTRAYTLCLRGRQTSGHIIFLPFSLLRKLTQL